jgi:hypothetical protein
MATSFYFTDNAYDRIPMHHSLTQCLQNNVTVTINIYKMKLYFHEFLAESSATESA